jgi:plasmid stabilization system protein ParE
VTRRLTLRQEARSDLADAASWYEDQRPGLGSDFVAEARQLLQQVADRPAQFRAVGKDVRRAQLRRFPYIIYFLVDPEEVLILAVVHKRRHPDLWRQRLESLQ